MKWSNLTYALSLTLLLAACGDKAKDNSAGTGPSTGMAATSAQAADTDTSWDQKVQSYIKINNYLNALFSTTNPEWQARKRQEVKNGDFKSIETLTFYIDSESQKNLQTAIDISAQLPEADAAAKALLATMKKFEPVWSELVSYNSAKKYEDDQGAKGRELLPAYIAGMTELERNLSAFDVQVDLLAKQAHAKNLARYKAEGKLLEASMSEALGAARVVADTFNTSSDFKDPAKIEKANAQIKILEDSVAIVKTEYVKRETEKTLPTLGYKYKSAAENLEKFAGYYREARKNPQKFNDAIEEFNKAVSDYNMIR